MPIPSHAVPEERTTHPLFTALRLLGGVVLLLMATSIAYAAWMVIKNWSGVGV